MAQAMLTLIPKVNPTTAQAVAAELENSMQALSGPAPIPAGPGQGPPAR